MVRRVLAALLLAALPGSAGGQETTFFRIASGNAGGTYFPVAALLAEAVSPPPDAADCRGDGPCGVPGLVAIAQSSQAAVANVRAVQAGAVESGLASADVVNAAFEGVGRFADEGPFDRLRVIASLYPEHLQLVLPAGETLASLADLEGRRLGIGEAGSGTRLAVEALLEAAGLGFDDVDGVALDANRSAVRLAAGDVDAFVYVAGVPTAAMERLAGTGGLTLYGLAPNEIDAVVAAMPAYRASTLPAGVYEGVEARVATVAVAAQWLTSVDQPEPLIRDVTAALWSERARRLFARGHPAAAAIRPEGALEGVGIPLHPGAARFYDESGDAE